MSNYAHIPIDVYHDDLAEAQNSINLLVEEIEAHAHNFPQDIGTCFKLMQQCFEIQRDLLILPYVNRDKFYDEFSSQRDDVQDSLDGL